jgi:hypothetical protein
MCVWLIILLSVHFYFFPIGLFSKNIQLGKWPDKLLTFDHFFSNGLFSKKNQLGKWPAKLGLVEKMHLKAGERTKAWTATVSSVGDPSCFVWAAPGGVKSVKFFAQLSKNGKTSTMTTSAMTEGTFALCNEYGTSMKFSISAESSIDQDILVGWKIISQYQKKNIIKPGYNNYDTLAAHSPATH